MLATNPEVLTVEPGPNKRPLGLTKKTCPFAVSDPKICEACEPITRLSSTEDELGCNTRTCSPAAMLNDCQLMAAF